jgi:hypothetical protein
VGARAGRFELRSVSPDASPEEIAAITAAIAASIAATRAESAAAADTETRSSWVQAARITARRAGYSRGEWRLSGRLGRRNRA